MLAKWLKSVTLDVASRDPTNQHAAFLGAFLSEFTLGLIYSDAEYLSSFSALISGFTFEAACSCLCEFGGYARVHVGPEEWAHHIVSKQPGWFAKGKLFVSRGSEQLHGGNQKFGCAFV